MGTEAQLEGCGGVEFQQVHVGCDQAVMEEREPSALFGRRQLFLRLGEDCCWELAQRVLYSGGHGRLSTTVLFLFLNVNLDYNLKE